MQQNISTSQKLKEEIFLKIEQQSQRADSIKAPYKYAKRLMNT